VHPPLEPFARGHLTVADGNEIYWETSGNPEGLPALYLHGGPGSGLGAGGYRRRYDPSRYLIVGLDQRGCGRSRPVVTESLAALQGNTTAALIADIEELRGHLGIETWLVSGASWGTTLALAYAQAHPERVTHLVLVAVTTTSRDEVDWITEGVGRIFPEAWREFDRASGRRPGERVVDAYARTLAHGSPAERSAAALAWDRWESTHVSLDPHWTPGLDTADPAEREVFARLVTHYWSQSAFLTDGAEILNQMEQLAPIPAALIHGRRDISGPVDTAWRLHQHWPASSLTIVEDEGHGGPIMMQLMCDAIDGFAAGS
jgi:proline iminopeptidase